MKTTAEFDSKIAEFVAALQESVNAKHQLGGYTFPPNKVYAKQRMKFVAIDIGGSGCFLVEKETGEIFNIKGYGVPDRNKKRKADIGNIYTADLSKLLAVRYNYLR
jgi:hypothetical protein